LHSNEAELILVYTILYTDYIIIQYYTLTLIMVYTILYTSSANSTVLARLVFALENTKLLGT